MLRHGLRVGVGFCVVGVMVLWVFGIVCCEVGGEGYCFNLGLGLGIGVVLGGALVLDCI